MTACARICYASALARFTIRVRPPRLPRWHSMRTAISATTITMASAGFSARQLALLLVLQGRVDEATTYVAQARAAFHDMGALAPLASLQAIELYGQLAARPGSARPRGRGSVLRRLERPGALPGSPAAAAAGAGARRKRRTRARAGADPRHRIAMRPAGLSPISGRRAALAPIWPAYATTADARSVLRAGWELVAADDSTSSHAAAAALHDVVLAALRQNRATAIRRLLRQQMPEQAMELLRGLLEHPSRRPRQRRAAAGRAGRAAAYPSLRALLKDRSAPVRKAAEDALSRLVYRPPYNCESARWAHSASGVAITRCATATGAAARRASCSSSC